MPITPSATISRSVWSAAYSAAFDCSHRTRRPTPKRRNTPHSKRYATWCAIALFQAATLFGQPLAIRTLAGALAPGATNGFGSNARFKHPQAVTADPSGNIFVADTENSTIRKITPDGLTSTLAGFPGSFGSTDGSNSLARFYGPQAIVTDGTGQLYVADTANSTIRILTTDGHVSTLAGAPSSFNSLDGSAATARFYHPEGLAADAAGNLYIADTWNHTIRKLNPLGVVSTLAGSAGNFGAADGTNSRARFHRPVGLALDSATNLFVADSFNHTIRKITPAGLVTTIAGLPGVWGSNDGTNSSAHFYLPVGLALTASGELLVADSGNQTLRKVSPSGTNWVVTTIAGLSGWAGDVNGSGSHAQFDFPAGLALDPSGYLYLADSANNTIRTTRIVPPTLQFVTHGGQVVLSWPASAEGFILEQSPTLAPAAWTPATNGIGILSDNFVLTNTLAGPDWWRLRFP